MKRKLARTALSLAVVVGAVLAFRWTVRAVLSRSYRAARDVGPVEMPYVPAPRVHDLAALHLQLHLLAREHLLAGS